MVGGLAGEESLLSVADYHSRMDGPLALLSRELAFDGPTLVQTNFERESFHSAPPARGDRSGDRRDRVRTSFGCRAR